MRSGLGSRLGRTGGRQSRVILKALIAAEGRGESLTAAELITAVSVERGFISARRTLRLLQRAGVIAIGPEHTIITADHLWLEKPVMLTDLWQLSAATLHSHAGPGGDTP
jgi:hypothetical protein